MSWFEGQVSRIHRAPSPCVIDARPIFGVPYLFHAIASTFENVLWIELSDSDDSVQIGNRLSNGLLRATGATLFGMGMPYQYGLSYLMHLTEQLGPISLLVSSAHSNIRFVRAAFKASRASSGALRVVVSGHVETEEWRELINNDARSWIDENDLRLSSIEAEGLLPTATVEALDAEALSAALRLANGAYEGFLAGVAGATGDPPPKRPSPDGLHWVRPSDETEAGQLQHLMAAERWQEAFECAVHLESELALDLLADAADLYFSNGEVPRFLHVLQRLADREQTDSRVMYWLFQAHLSVGQLPEIEDRAARFIEHHVAPELQASFATAVRPPDAVALAESAVATARTPETLAALGFFRVLQADAAVGVDLLKEAFEGYKLARRHHKAIQVSNSIGSAYVQLGQYRRAMYWATWSLDELRRRSIREELLRLSSVNLLAFTQLLIGELEAGQELLRRIEVDIEGSLPSTLEGLISTLGDYALTSGRPQQALRYYHRLVAELGSQLPGFTTLNYVRGLLHADRPEDAAAALDVARDLSGTMDSFERAKLDLARVMVTVVNGNYTPDTFLRTVATDPFRSDGVMRAELATYHAWFLREQGSVSQARAVLRENEDVLGELGRSGWALLCPPGSNVESLQSLMSLERPAENRLMLLASRTLVRRDREDVLPLRVAELLVVLAMHPEGLSGEALLYEVYGEDGVMGTLKANVSRSRRFAAIASQPYRLESPLSTDFLDTEHHLRLGNLREALELYKGPLLPESEAPGVRRARERLDEAVRQAVLHAGEWDLALRLARKFHDDLELWEEAERLAPKNDPAYPLIRARIRRIRGEWGL